MNSGWIIGVLIGASDADGPVRHYYAVAQEDRARAEWAAADTAITAGPIAASPTQGMEPIEAIGEISVSAVRSLGLSAGEVRALGWKWPRRWLATEPVAKSPRPD